MYPSIGLVLFGLTWKLWTPQDVFPQVSLVSLDFSFPIWLEWSCCVGILLGLVGQLVSTRETHSRIASALFLLSAGLLLIDDTHRLQPWAWHLFLVNILWHVAPQKDRVKFIIWLTATIYLFSGVSKIDVNFVNGAGGYLLDGLLKAMTLSPTAISDQMRTVIIWSFPFGEFLVGIGLLWKRTFRVAIVLSVFMHLVLLITLGPLGLNHHWPVLGWNLLFITQNTLLGILHRQQTPVADTEITKATNGRVVVCFLMLALPVLNFASLWPHWLSWGLYSERISNVFVYVTEEARNKLPEYVQKYAPKSSLDGNYCRLRTDRMSLGELNAPEFPQERFQIGVALAFARKYGWGDGFLLVIKSPPDRRTGWRDSRECSGQSAVEKLAKENRL